MIAHRSTRPGLTLVETVVVAAIGLTVLGLLVVFITRQRHSGERVECMAHLKVIGDGVKSFHEMEKFLPPARIANGYATWAVLLAPHLRPTHPLQRWDLGLPFAKQEETLRREPLPFYFCPARLRTTFTNSEGALGDYAVASGDGNPEFPWDGAKANGAMIVGEVLEQKDDHIFRWRGRVTFGMLTRGQSNTLLAGDKHVPSETLGQTQFGDGPLYDGGFPATSARVGGLGFPLSKSPAEPFQHNFGSSHAGVCLFLAADGGVRTFANDMDPALLARLIVRE